MYEKCILKLRERYKEAANFGIGNSNKNLVIFICPFDLFGDGRYRYTFENICRENKTLLLGDGTAKIFLNTEGTVDDPGVGDGLKAFLHYVGGGTPNDSFVRKLEEAVEAAKKNREWTHEYMTLLMRDQENIERGKIYGAISMCRALIISCYGRKQRPSAACSTRSATAAAALPPSFSPTLSKKSRRGFSYSSAR